MRGLIEVGNEYFHCDDPFSNDDQGSSLLLFIEGLLIQLTSRIAVILDAAPLWGCLTGALGPF
jgi:hypothetical protein